MPDLAGPFDIATWMQDRWYRDAWARARSGVFGTGFGDPALGELPLTVAGLTVSMGLGRAHVRGAGYERTGTAWSYDVPPNTDPNPRIDRLVLRRNLATSSVVPLVLQGAPAASPVAPALSRVEDGAWDLPLYRFTVPANSGAPLTGVVDERVPGGGSRHWGSVPGSPPSIEDAAAMGVLPGDTIHSVGLGAQFEWFGQGIGVGSSSNWRQTTIAMTADLAAYQAAAVAADWVPPQNGFLIFDTTTDRLYSSRYNGVGVVNLVGGQAGGTVSSGFTAASGWSVDSAFCRSLGNGMAYAYLQVLKTGSALTVGTTGDVTNVNIGKVPAGWEPLFSTAAQSGAGGRVASGSLLTDGFFNLGAVGAGGVDVSIGHPITLACVYPLADATRV
jgi:hypothetical protein